MDLASHVRLPPSSHLGSPTSLTQDLAPGENFSGQPDFCWLDALNRPVASICFPFEPGTIVPVGNARLTMVAERVPLEQQAVSKIYNSTGILGGYLRPGSTTCTPRTARSTASADRATARTCTRFRATAT